LHQLPLDECPEIAHTARDRLAQLHRVAAGCGLSTLPVSLVSAVPPGVRVLRRIALVRLIKVPPRRDRMGVEVRPEGDLNSNADGRENSSPGSIAVPEYGLGTGGLP
jgi:hypothetical protein